jgi:hypothetical protein
MTRTTIQSTDITDGSIVNSDVNASAAIVASKLSGVESGLTSVQTFTSSGTWTRPTGITKVIVEIQGAGGSGTDGNSTSATMNSGASGGYVKKLIDVSSITSATITIGTGGAASSTTTGNAGGNSVWSDGTNTLTAGGGGGGLSTSYYGGIGGTAVGGDLNIAGQNGGAYAYRSGGDSQFGYGGIYGASAASGSSPDTTGILPVGYGSGSVAVYNGTSAAGAPGIVIVTEYK